MLWKRLQNPYALVAQGFFVGGLIYFATHIDSIEPRAGDSAAQASASAAPAPGS